jgi:predicted DNA-binding transcriptional regulator YafY
MIKKSVPASHPYTDQFAFERLMLLVTTLVRYPGVGCPEEEITADSDQALGYLANPNAEDSHSSQKQHHDALQAVRTRLQAVAHSQGVQFPEDYPAVATLRKDLETLRRYGVLDQRMYRWSYYLGTGVMSLEELQVTLNAIASQAKGQGDPQVRQIYQMLSQRLRGLNLELKGELFYPVRQQLNRPVGYTDPQEMMALGKNQDTLFHQLDIVEKAIPQGQALELSRNKDPYGQQPAGPLQIWPLQLVYHDIAWYLLYEHCHSGHLAIGRINRFKNHCKVLEGTRRGLQIQKQRLETAHRLLENGWGLFLGKPEEQEAELQGRLKLETVKVRFFSSMITFILGGERRHCRQHIRKGPKDKTTGQLDYVDYTVRLPRRSFEEFSRWVYRYMHFAKVLAPQELIERHKAAALNLQQLYE